VQESLAQIRRIAALVDNAEAGEVLVSRIERAIDAARLPPGAPRLTAAVYETGGLTAGGNTVTDDLMRTIGLDNLAAHYGIKTHQPMQLELLLAAPPDLLLVGEVPGADGTQAARVVQHRALRKVRSKRWDFPARFMYCSGPTIVEEAAALARARDSVYATARAQAAR
jgi:iron complex transport system substrate-binding protein